MEKAYRKITWHDGGQPPISAENLQAISDGLSLVDDRVIELDQDKLDATTVSPVLGDVIKWDGTRWVNGPTPGGGGSGTSDYQDLSHKPSINGVTLAGDVSGSELGFVDSEVTDEIKAGLTAGDGLMFRFAEDGEGNYGYLKADGSFVPFKSGGGGAVIEQIYQASVKQSTGFSFTPDADVKGFAICDANIVYAFATTDMTIKRLYNNNGIISLTKNANGSFTLKWTSQYTSTVTLTVFGIK